MRVVGSEVKVFICVGRLLNTVIEMDPSLKCSIKVYIREWKLPF